MDPSTTALGNASIDMPPPPLPGLMYNNSSSSSMFALVCTEVLAEAEEVEAVDVLREVRPTLTLPLPPRSPPCTRSTQASASRLLNRVSESESESDSELNPASILFALFGVEGASAFELLRLVSCDSYDGPGGLRLCDAGGIGGGDASPSPQCFATRGQSFVTTFKALRVSSCQRSRRIASMEGAFTLAEEDPLVVMIVGDASHTIQSMRLLIVCVTWVGSTSVSMVSTRFVTPSMKTHRSGSSSSS